MLLTELRITTSSTSTTVNDNENTKENYAWNDNRGFGQKEIVAIKQ